MKQIIKVTSGDPKLSELLLRQTPGLSGEWGNCRFLVNQPVEKCDWWFVMHSSGLRQAESTSCDPKKVVYLSMEPTEQVLGTRQAFLEQFGTVVLTDRSVRHPDIVYANAHTWWVGFKMSYGPGGHVFEPEVRLSYDQLKHVEPENKKNRISIVVSNKQFLPGHKARLEFLKTLRNHQVAKYIDLYGGGFNPIGDKWDAIAPYKYHIALENSVIDDYWSEKLADSMLASALTFYHGCPNINSYFSESALVTININHPQNAADAMLTALENNLYSQRVQEIEAAKKQVLDRYNVFNLMATLSQRNFNNLRTPESITLHPNNHFKI